LPWNALIAPEQARVSVVLVCVKLWPYASIGYDLGILSPPIFTMLVLVALVTTGMTGPMLGLSDYLRTRHVLRAKLV
jgi:hypothetical protein